MGLLQNVGRLNAEPLRLYAGASFLCTSRSNFNRPDCSLNIYFNNTIDRTSGKPNGYNPPYQIVMPIKAGGLSSYINIVGDGEATVISLSLGRYISNTVPKIIGSGGISSANLIKLSYMLSTILNSGSLTASTFGTQRLESSMVCSSSLSFIMTGLLSSLSGLSGDGDISSELRGEISMSSDVVGEGSVSAQLSRLLFILSTLAGEGSSSVSLFGSQSLSAGITTGSDLEILLKGVLHTKSSMDGNGAVTGNIKGNLLLLSNLVGDSLVSAQFSRLLYLLSSSGGEGQFHSDMTGVQSFNSPLDGAGGVDGYLVGMTPVSAYVQGDSSLVGTLLGNLILSASIEGAGESEAVMGKAIQIVLNMVGEGELAGLMVNTLRLASNLSGSGDIEGSLSVIAWLISVLRGEGELLHPILHCPMFMGADISLLGGTLTAQSIADAVWNSLVVSYNKSETMGEKMNDAGSASNPWGEIIEGDYTAEEIFRIILSTLVGLTSVEVTPDKTIVRFRDTSDLKDRVVSELDGSERTKVTLDGA